MQSSPGPTTGNSADLSEPSPTPRRTRPRIHPAVAVILLETIQSQDVPQEVLEAEDPTVTLPRRLGLSDAVTQQIARYREAARKRQRLTDEELENLIRLAIRRPDSQDILFLTGEGLAGSESSRMSRALPKPVGFALARRRVRRLLKTYFGRRIGGFSSGAFAFEGRALLFIQSDPGGDGCALVTGLCQAVVSQYVRGEPLVIHSVCQALGGDICGWSVGDDPA